MNLSVLTLWLIKGTNENVPNLTWISSASKDLSCEMGLITVCWCERKDWSVLSFIGLLSDNVSNYVSSFGMRVVFCYACLFLNMPL